MANMLVVTCAILLVQVNGVPVGDAPNLLIMDSPSMFDKIQIVKLNKDAIGSEVIELPNKEKVHLQEIENDKEDVSRNYRNDQGFEATLTFKNHKLVYGVVDLLDVGTFEIEENELNQLVWKKRNDRTEEEDDNDSYAGRFLQDSDRSLEVTPEDIARWKNHANFRMESLLKQGKEDTTTVVTYTITFYYTREVNLAVKDIKAYFDQIIAETNQAYINSKIPLRVKIHCLRRSTVADENLFQAMDDFKGKKGDNFANMGNDLTKSPFEPLRLSGDVAVLIVENGNGVCGLASSHSGNRFDPVVGVRRDCAVGRYTVAHEIGHVMGLSHDHLRQESLKAWYMSGEPYGYGYHLKLGKSGLRTIMAYDFKMEKKINYFSNPRIKVEGLVAGVEEYADSAKLLTERRFAMAEFGDEKTTCPAQKISCGRTERNSCDECGGEDKCNGNCIWMRKEGKCKDKFDVKSKSGKPSVKICDGGQCKMKPICKNYFEGNNEGLDYFCRKLGFLQGILKNNQISCYGIGLERQGSWSVMKDCMANKGSARWITLSRPGSLNACKELCMANDECFAVSWYKHWDGVEWHCYPSEKVTKEDCTKWENTDTWTLEYEKTGIVEMEKGSFNDDCYFQKDIPGFPKALMKGTVESPNYPNVYPNNIEIPTTIKVSEGKRIEMKWMDPFDLEKNGFSEQCYDSINVVDGNGDKLLNTFCGRRKPQKIISKTNKVIVTFKSDGSGPRKGFKVKWFEIP